jgi:23S rRNA (pseudouridine1915-N3)-methyltransferase
LRLRIVVVGRLKDPGLKALCNEYERRIRRHVEIEQLEVKDAGAFAQKISADASCVALEVLGVQWSSSEFADQLQRWAERKKGRVTFFIGGAEGIPSAQSERMDAQLSLSSMTLPHRLARVLLCEQLYRATTIWRGEPYAREG